MKRKRIILAEVLIGLFVIGFSAIFLSCGNDESSNTSSSIRSDVRQYVNEAYTDSQKREALLQHAKALQKVFSAKTESEAISVNLDIIDSFKKIQLLGEISGTDAPSRVVMRKTFGTPEWLRVMRDYENLLGNHSFEISSPENTLLISAAIFASASSIISPSPAADCVFVYINGMNTSNIDAIYDITKLTPAILNNTTKQLKIILAYNPTRKRMSDLADVFEQKLKEYPGVKSDLILKALLYATIDPALPQLLQDSITQYHANKIKDYGYVRYSDSDLQGIMADILGSKAEGQVVIFFAHSQGCLYANEIYLRMTTGDSAMAKTAIGIVAIGSPAAYVAKGGYLTSTNDLIIALLRSSGFSVLPSNITISLTTKDMRGHSLTDVYLNPELEGRAEVLNLINTVIDSLYFPSGGLHPVEWGEVTP